MDVSELAGLVAREADLGVSTALSALDAGGLLVVDRVVARVGGVPGGGATSLDDVTWQAEVVMRPTREPGTPRPATLPQRLAALPIVALRGVGTAWSARLTEVGLSRVGDLVLAEPTVLSPLAERYGVVVYELAGRARSLVGCWPAVPAEASTWGTILGIAGADPTSLPTDEVLARAVWNGCLTALAAVDAEVLAGMRLG